MNDRTATMDPRSAASTLEERLQEYSPESYHDFSDPDVAEGMRAAIAQVASELGRDYPARIGGEDVRLESTRTSTDPSRPGRVVGVFPAGGQGLADRAIDAANAAFATWKKVPASERAAVLFRAADIMRRRRLELAAWMVLRGREDWAEADADIAEAIDFCEYYARQMLRYATSRTRSSHTTRREQRDDLHAARRRRGHPAVELPARDPGRDDRRRDRDRQHRRAEARRARRSTIGWKFVELMDEAGLPPGVLNFVTGPGEVRRRRAWCEHPGRASISFTGSREVGLERSNARRRRASRPDADQARHRRDGRQGRDRRRRGRRPRRGGRGRRQSAFGFQGQKCSACSRAIVDARSTTSSSSGSWRGSERSNRVRSRTGA